MNDIDWQDGEPPANILLHILCDDFCGEYISKASRKDYKTPRKGQSPKGFMNKGKGGWRWISEKGEVLSRKDRPSKWAYIEDESK